MKPSKPHTRCVVLGSKFTPAEAVKLRRAANNSGTTVSTLLHDLAIKGEIHPRPQIAPIAVEQWRALAPLASNLNQLAKGMNSGMAISTTDVSDAVTALRSTLGEIRDTLIDMRKAA